jgi:hypothetical protein
MYLFVFILLCKQLYYGLYLLHMCGLLKLTLVFCAVMQWQLSKSLVLFEYQDFIPVMEDENILRERLRFM